MGRPITTTAGGIALAFPNVCMTPAPPGPPVPIPYPSIGQLSSATGTSPTVKAGGSPVVTKASVIPSTTGDAAGNAVPGKFGGKVEFTGGSATVFADGNGVVRQFDTTSQNNGNAQGSVLAGFPTVLVGG
jgi:hypothetical protein